MRKHYMGWRSPFCVSGKGDGTRKVRGWMVCAMAAILWCLPSFPNPPEGSPDSLTAVKGLPIPVVHRPHLHSAAGMRGKRFIPATPSRSGEGFTGYLRPDPVRYGGVTPEAELLSPAEGIPFPEPESAQTREELSYPPADLPDVSRQPDRRISMREEMLRVSDLDSGKYGSLHDGLMKGDASVEGFLTLSSVWGEDLRVTGESTADASLRSAIMHLAEAVNRFTGLRTRLKSHTFLSEEGLQKLPFLYITTDTAFELMESERINLGNYLRNGGFAFIENSDLSQVDSPAEYSLRRMLREALGSQARFEPIPMRHPLYHCFFDFTEEPPHGVDIKSIVKGIQSVRGCLCASSWASGYIMTKTKSTHSLEGIFYQGELVAVFSNKGYGLKWKDTEDNVPQLKMGVNLVVYALTREGGMTCRNTERFRMDTPATGE